MYVGMENYSFDLNLTKLQIFEVLFPTKWVKEVLIPETNKNLDGYDMCYREFLQFVGILLKICTQVGFQRHDFWADDKAGKRNSFKSP